MKSPLTLLLSLLIFSALGQERLSDFPFELTPNINSVEIVDTLNGRVIVNTRSFDSGGQSATWSTDGTTAGTFELKSDQKVTELNARNARRFGKYISWLHGGVFLTNGQDITRISDFHSQDLEIITSRNNGFLSREHSNPRSLNKNYEIHLIDGVENKIVLLEDSVRAYTSANKYFYYLESENLDSFHLWEVIDGQKSLQNRFQFKEVPRKVDAVQVKDQIYLLISFDSSKTLLSKRTGNNTFEVVSSFNELAGNPLQTFIKDENDIPYFFINEPSGLISRKLEESKWIVFTKKKLIVL